MISNEEVSHYVAASISIYFLERKTQTSNSYVNRENCERFLCARFGK